MEISANNKEEAIDIFLSMKSFDNRYRKYVKVIVIAKAEKNWKGIYDVWLEKTGPL